MLDTARRVATPEGIELTLRLAGPVPRALAWAIDLLVRAAILGIIALTATALRQFGTAVILLSAFLIEWLYPAWFEASWGATPGKRALGLIVLNDDGTPVRWSAALTRNLLRAADFLPAMYLGGFVAMVMNRDFKRLGDLAANTLVVYREEKLEPLAIPEGDPHPPGFALTIAEQRAILDFAARSTGLTQERAEELAEIPRSLTGGASRGVAASRLIGIANYLMGRQ
ncbi:MAG: RDD family protein [Betaproteobacteria bacterium]|nr:RDD family protein [Betaproteobacteria bacterium]